MGKPVTPSPRKRLFAGWLESEINSSQRCMPRHRSALGSELSCLRHRGPSPRVGVLRHNLLARIGRMPMAPIRLTAKALPGGDESIVIVDRIPGRSDL
jgi:hypothetical protein